MEAEIGATIAFSAIENNDKVGVIFFSDKIEKFIPPKKGRKHILLVIRELLYFKPENKGTNVGLALEYLTSVIKKRCTTFLISDFIDDKDYYKPLSIANSKHDVMALQIYDQRETQLPDVGLMRVYDAETGAERWIDTSSARVRKAVDRWWYEQQRKLNDTVQRARVDLVSMATHEDYVKALLLMFKKRAVIR